LNSRLEFGMTHAPRTSDNSSPCNAGSGGTARSEPRSGDDVDPGRVSLSSEYRHTQTVARMETTITCRD